MKKLPVSLLILACFFSSPNLGMLFTCTAKGLLYRIPNPAFDGRAVIKVRTPDQVPFLTEAHKKARLMKRTLCTVDPPTVLHLSLFAFFLFAAFFVIPVSRRPVSLLLRSPPQFQHPRSAVL